MQEVVERLAKPQVLWGVCEQQSTSPGAQDPSPAVARSDSDLRADKKKRSIRSDVRELAYCVVEAWILVSTIRPDLGVVDEMSDGGAGDRVGGSWGDPEDTAVHSGLQRVVDTRLHDRRGACSES
jgi:hypothetical protein